ncbi:MAG: ABC transporter permease [Planctomycetia bacterium]|nr:ABC transporter permease [Planctomycetia bacterium]
MTIPIVAVATVALAANTAFFAVVDSTFLQEPAVRDSANLVYLDLAPADLAGLVTHNRSRLGELQSYFEGTKTVANHAAINLEPAFDTASPAQTEWRLRSAYVSPGFTDLFGVSPVAGHALSDAGSIGSPRDVLIAYDLWRARFGLDRAVIGRVIEISGSQRDATWRVAGVMPPGFHFPKGVNFWIASAEPNPLRIPTFARLAPHVSIEQLRAEVRPVRVIPFTDYVRPENAVFVLYFAIAGLGSIIGAWLQVGSLLLTRTVERTTELRVRRALGATGRDLMTLVVLESGLLVALSLVLSWLMTPILAGVIVRLLPDSGVFAEAVRLDWRAIVFSSVIAGAGMVMLSIGCLSAVRHADPLPLSRGGSEGHEAQTVSRIRRSIFVLQIGSATALLYIAAMVGDSYVQVASVDLGFVPERLLVLPVPSLPRQPLNTDRDIFAERRAHTARVLERVKGLHGVAGAAASGVFPLQQSRCEPQLFVAGKDKGGQGIAGLVCGVTSGFFDVLDVTLTRGAEPTPNETLVLSAEGGPAVANTSLARYLQQFGEPVDQDVFLKPAYFHRVVGVAPDIKLDRPDDRDRPTLFVYGRPADGSVVLIRIAATEDIASLAQSVQGAGREVWGARAPRHVVQLKDVAVRATADYRGRAMIIWLACLGAVPLVLAGLAGASAHAFAQRRRELAMRMALGLAPLGVAAYFLRQFTTSCLLSVSIGIAVGIAASRSMGALMFGVSGTYVPAAIGVASVMVLVCLLMIAIPLRRLGRTSIAQMLGTQ